MTKEELDALVVGPFELPTVNALLEEMKLVFLEMWAITRVPVDAPGKFGGCLFLRTKAMPVIKSFIDAIRGGQAVLERRGANDDPTYGEAHHKAVKKYWTRLRDMDLFNYFMDTWHGKLDADAAFRLCWRRLEACLLDLFKLDSKADRKLLHDVMREAIAKLGGFGQDALTRQWMQGRLTALLDINQVKSAKEDIDAFELYN